MYALTESDFTNTGRIRPSSIQFESNSVNNDSAVVVLPKGSTISIAADTSAMSSPTAADDLVRYTITVDNIGLLGLTGIQVSDSLVAPAEVVLVSGDTNGDSVLDADETWVYVADYRITQNDIDSNGGGDGVLNNTATVSSSELAAVDDSVAVDIESAPAVSVSADIDQSAVSGAGLVTYSITVTNTGNTSLTSVDASSVLPDGTPGSVVGPGGDSGTSNVLDVGEQWTYTVSYYVTQDDIDAGTDLVSTIQVLSAQTGGTVESTDAVVTIDQQAAMLVGKQVDKPSLSAPGILEYIITIANDGNVSLSGINPVDSLPDGSTTVLSGPDGDAGAIGVLDVGETWQYTTSYSATQGELDAGAVLTNKVDVTSDQTGSTPISASATTNITRSPAFALSKTVDKAVIGTTDLLTYSIEIENTGNTSLTGLQLTDTLPDGSIAIVSGPAADAQTPNILDVGETWQFSTQYIVTQGDINSGVTLINSVETSFAEIGAKTATASTSINQAPSMELGKSVFETGFTSVGDTLNYTIGIRNSGNVLLSDVTVEDPDADPGTLLCSESQPFTLAPGEFVECSAIRTIQQEDIARTLFDNRAYASASDVAGNVLDTVSPVVSANLNRVAPVATEDTGSTDAVGTTIILAGGSDDIDTNDDLALQTVSLVDPAAVDTDGDGDYDRLTVAGQGTWQVNNTDGTVSFTPVVGYTGDPAPVSYIVGDNTGLVSNAALLVADYPQTAPLARDDIVENPLASSPQNPTLIAVLQDNGNGADTDAENDLLESSVSLLAPGASDTDGDGFNDLLVVSGQGTWTVDAATAIVSFTPITAFVGDPEPVAYTVSDRTGLVSNAALITVDYPQNAPVAVDDTLLDQPLNKPVSVAVLANDFDPEDNLDPATLKLVDMTGHRTDSVVVEGEGRWELSAQAGFITFTPIAGFIDDPSPVKYVVSDTTDLESNEATVTVTYEDPVTLQGTVWVDNNRNGIVDDGEHVKAGWTLRVYSADGELLGTTITDENGAYSLEGLAPGVLTIRFYNENDVFMDEQRTNGAVLAGQTVDLGLPVDPGGIVYDSVSRVPLAGVTLNMLNEDGMPVSAACLARNQQSQTTNADGIYAFNLFAGVDDTCPSDGVYRIDIAQAPEEYHPNFSTLIRQEGAGECGDAALGCAVSATFDSAFEETDCTVDAIAGTNACEVQTQPQLPATGDDTMYFVEFVYAAGDRNVIFNHLPMDARANDAQLLLTKLASKPEVSAGDVLGYTLTVENTLEIPAVSIAVSDKAPAGFAFAENSVRLVRAGVDGVLGTDDDVRSAVSVTDRNGLIGFSLLDLQPMEKVRYSYLLRVGTGVVPGTYANKASATGPGGVASNTVSATVDVVADPVLGQATLVGKVFHDRDRDGAQDPASATDVRVTSEYYGKPGLLLPSIPGRKSVADDPDSHAVVVNMPLTGNEQFTIATREGSRITVNQQGDVTEAHVGLKARGLNSQDIRVCTGRTIAVPTLSTGVTSSTPAEQDVLQIVLGNYGIDEQGLPGVRLATVTGLVIETDAYGRYSIPDVSAGLTGVGENLVVKVDRSTLPVDATFTTENPYVLRIVSGSLNKINFGVNVPEVDNFADAKSALCKPAGDSRLRQRIEVNLGAVFFMDRSSEVREDQQGIVRDIIAKFRQYGGGRIYIESQAASSDKSQNARALAQKRAQSIRKTLTDALGKDLMGSISVEVRESRMQEQGQ